MKTSMNTSMKWSALFSVDHSALADPGSILHPSYDISISPVLNFEKHIGLQEKFNSKINQPNEPTNQHVEHLSCNMVLKITCKTDIHLIIN